MDPTISFDDLDIIRGMWPGKIVVKGVQTVEDAKLLADRGVDGVVLSNHGGRQLDRAPIPFHLLPHVAREVGKIRKLTKMPIAVGFGISNAKQAKAIGAVADGIVIGSAVVKLIDENRNNSELVKVISNYTREIKEALR